MNKPDDRVVPVSNLASAPINKRLAIALAMTVAVGHPLASTQDVYRFQPPQSPPLLQKPNRKARRAELRKKKRPKA